MLTVLSILSLAQISIPIPSYSSPSAVPSPPSGLPTPASPNQFPPIITAPPPVAPSRPVDVVQHQTVHPLPGQLDDVPVFNSNSPELIQSDGILLSTFPSDGMRVPSAHLDFPLKGRFDIFAHHVARGLTLDDTRTLFLGIVLYNPGNEPVTVDILQATSYLSQDAPFTDLPDYVADPTGAVYAGPGSRTTSDVLRGNRQPQWPAQVTIPPRQSYLLVNLPIPLRRLTVATDGTLPQGYIIPTPRPTSAQPVTAEEPDDEMESQQPGMTTAAALARLPAITSQAATAATKPSTAPPPILPPIDRRLLPTNGRTVLMHLSSSGSVYVASLAMFAPKTPGGDERVPTLTEWLQLLQNGTLAGPRDHPPTPPNSRFVPRFYYGRVAGIAEGSEWSAIATDSPNVDYLSIPQPGHELSYVISTVDRNTLGTEQIQSAPILVRYSDTAYRAHGNYGVFYNISLPLYNHTNSTQRVVIMLQTPLQDERLKNGLRFRDPPYDQIFFRGTVRLRYTDDFRIPQTRYFHVVQRRGQEGQPLLRLTLPRGSRRLVEVQFIYPPDSTPPQVLTVETDGNPEMVEIR